MPAFYILFVIGVVLLWFLSYWLFKPIGRIVTKIINNVKKTIKEEEEGEKNE